MSQLENIATMAPAPMASPKKLLAAPRHTLTLFLIVTALTVAGIWNASKHVTANQVVDATSMIKNDLIMIGMLWLWVWFVYKGMQDHGRSILEFFDFKSFTPLKFVSDCAYGALALALIYGCSIVVHHVFPSHASPSNNPLLTSTPEGLLGIAAWLGVSISAGISEEIVFRGYLQRQLTLMTGNVVIAILAQGILFGIGHAYEGLSSVLAIVVHGVILGMLATWRGNIRAGIVEHAGWDILAGFGLIGANW